MLMYHKYFDKQIFETYQSYFSAEKYRSDSVCAKRNIICVRCTQMKKSKSFDLDFLAYHYKIAPYKAIVQKQPVFFSQQIDLSLGDAELRKFLEKRFPNYAGKRSLCSKTFGIKFFEIYFIEISILRSKERVSKTTYLFKPSPFINRFISKYNLAGFW